MIVPIQLRGLLKVLKEGGWKPFPAAEQTLCLFVAKLNRRGIAGSSVKVYLAAIRYLRLHWGLGIHIYPLVQARLCNKKKTTCQRRKPRLPITPATLHQLRAVGGKLGDTFNARMLWAAACMCFFGFLCSGEVVVPSTKDPAVHLSEGYVRVDNIANPTYIEVSIKVSRWTCSERG